MKAVIVFVVSILATVTFHFSAHADNPGGWTEYPYGMLKVRQTKGHAPLVSTAAVQTEDGLVVISDFGQKGEYIRCFDTFNKSFQPTGERVCWRR